MNINFKRIIALLIDVFIISLFTNFINRYLKTSIDLWSSESRYFTFTISIGAFFIFLLIYLILFDIYNSGDTLGKIIVKIKKIKNNGSDLNLKERVHNSILKVLAISFWPISLIIFLIKKNTIQDLILETKTISK